MSHYSFFLFLYGLTFLYVILKKREVDLFTITILSLLYYSFPLVIGRINFLGVVEDMLIVPKVYLIYSFNLVLILLITFVNDKTKINFPKKQSLNIELKIKILFFLMLCFFILHIMDVGFVNYLFHNKVSSTEKVGILFNFFIWTNLITLGVSYYYRKPLIFFISAILILSVLAFGVRSYFMVAVFLLFLLNRGFQRIRLAGKVWYFVFGVTVFLGMAFYSYIYKDLSYVGIANRLRTFDASFLIHNLFADPMAVVYNLQVSVENNVSLEPQYLVHRIVSFFPFGASFFSSILGQSFETYSSVLHQNFYPDITWGMASSLYGEVLALSGWFGLVFFMLIYLFSIFVFNKIFKRRKTIIQFFLLPNFIYICFYVHRIDFTFIAGNLKITLFIFLVFYFIYSFVLALRDLCNLALGQAYTNVVASNHKSFGDCRAQDK